MSSRDSIKTSRDWLNRAFCLPRLPREYYQGDAVVFWTLTTFEPDHIHLIWMGLRLDSDQINGMAFLRTYLEPALAPAKFQPQPQDNVLREEQRKRNAFAKVCFYVAANPVRGKLMGENETWQFTGCAVPGYPKLNPVEDDFWPKFWRIFGKLREPDAGHIIRPPIDWTKDQVRDSSRRLLQGDRHTA